MGQTDTGQTARRKDGKGEWLMNTQGLTSAQAVARLSQVGENRLAAKKQASVAAMFFSQFKDVMILILAAATLISVLMGQGAEARHHYRHCAAERRDGLFTGIPHRADAGGAEGA